MWIRVARFASVFMQFIKYNLKMHYEVMKV